MRRRTVALTLVVTLAATLAAVTILPTTAAGTPVATDETSYTALGRIWPDPHACQPPGGNASPWAKGTVCATDFIQYQEMIDGTFFLEEMFPDFVEVYTLHEDFNCQGEPVGDPKQGCDDFRSAGIPQTASGSSTLTRARQPMYLARVTDESVPDDNKKFFVFPLSIHGIERAGAEGGTRAMEDLATWAACEAKKAPAFVNCEHEDNAAPHPLLEATPDKSIKAGDALKRSAIYFLWPNPDGWIRGDRTNGPSFYQRYNGNGVDLNRDWPERGWTFRPYTPWSEPESRAYGRVLMAIGPHDAKGRPKWDGGIDLHGMVDAKAFSFTLLGGTQRPYDKDQRVLQTVKGAWADAEARLTYSPLIKPNTEPPEDPRQYGVQWGTIWDTIDYTVTGAFGNWIDSPMGLNADGIDNEMAFSHLGNCGVGSCFVPDIEQLHIEGNKSLIYSLIHYTLKPENTTFETKGRVAYLHNKGFITQPGDRLAPKPNYTKKPQQDPITDITLSSQNEYIHEFDVKGLPKFYNGGIEVLLTCTNVQGVGPCSASQGHIERFGKVEHPGGDEGGWETVNSYNGGADPYLQSGQALHANYPQPGRWRIRIASASSTDVFSAQIHFKDEAAWPDPGQLRVKATSMRFWQSLRKLSQPKIEKLTARQVRTTSKWKRRYDTIVITNRVYPKLAGRLRKWVWKQDGNLVLLDKGIKMMIKLGMIPPKLDDGTPTVGKVGVYAGFVNFQTPRRANTYEDRLARKVNQPGAAEGRGCQVKQSGITRGEACDPETDQLHRRQTYEPVPLGYSLNDGGDNSPIWFVRHAAWTKSLGKKQRAVASAVARDEIAYGEVKWRGGRVRIHGALLPDPTKEFDHTFGLSDYALTWAGYQLLQNLLTWDS